MSEHHFLQLMKRLAVITFALGVIVGLLVTDIFLT